MKIIKKKMNKKIKLKRLKKIIYSPGEPSGIGPDLIIQLCKSTFWTDVKTNKLSVDTATLKLLNNSRNRQNQKIPATNPTYGWQLQKK